jgi:hypothetical protein
MKDSDPLYLIHKSELAYPSGSTICFMNDRFYIMGDDASEILVLNDKLVEVERVPLFPKDENIRIPKAFKADIEASVVIRQNGVECVLFLGSGSVSPHRDYAYLFEPESKNFSRIDFSYFYDQLRNQFAQLNIEAATTLGNSIALGIRANRSYPDNYIALAIPGKLSPEFQRKVLLKLPVEHSGISGMDYDAMRDILFITFSSENTSNSYDDGEIGESYLAIIQEAADQIQKDELYISSLTKLSDLSTELNFQKVESVALAADNRQLLVVADNDQGNTNLFLIGF